MNLGSPLARPMMSRLFSLGIALGTGFVLLLAIWLTPDAAGHGTHTQLGLSQCSVLTYTGVPCPMCGMTTSFAWMTRGAVWRAMTAQPVGVFFFLITVMAFGTACIELVRPRMLWHKIWRALVAVEFWVVAGFAALLVLGWAYKIWMMWDIGK